MPSDVSEKLPRRRKRESDAIARRSGKLKTKLGKLQLDQEQQQHQWRRRLLLNASNIVIQCLSCKLKCNAFLNKQRSSETTLHRTIAATFERRLEEVMANMRLERQRALEDWDRSLVEGVNVTNTGSQKVIERAAADNAGLF